MSILLDEFEHQVDGKILKRGFEYFEQGYVIGVDELSAGYYEVTVEGTEMYTVRLSIDKKVVSTFECDCPYDMGPVCKHIVAALFYMQRNIFGTAELPVKRMSKKQDEKSVSEQAKGLLDILSHDELRSFVFNTCMTDSEFRQLFVAKHINFLYPESKDLYVKQLQALIITYSDRHGFMDYQQTKRLGGVVSEMIEEAMAGLTQGQVQKSMFTAWAIIEEIADLVNSGADDSDGRIGSCVEEAFSVLDALTELKLTKTQHDELFECLLALFKNDRLKGFGWHFNAIELSIRFLQTDHEKETIKSALKTIKPNGKSWDWDYKKAQELMLELIKKTESMEVAMQFVERNLSNSTFRIELIEKALKVKNYQEAERLALDGIALNEKDAPGLVEDWRNYLLMVYQQTGDVKNMVRLARHFLVCSNGRHNPWGYYYELLKSHIPKEEWHNYLCGLIDEIKKEGRWFAYDLISQIYVREAYWNELFTLLRNNVDFKRIIAAEQYLAESYSNELAILYRDEILRFLVRNIGRDHYRTACQYIRRIIKLGAHSMATDLVQELKKMYPTRRALLEELGRV